MNEETIESVGCQKPASFQPPAGPWPPAPRISSLEAYEALVAEV